MTMSNTFAAGGSWDPYSYANQALELLEMNLGLGRRVFRGYTPVPDAQDGHGSIVRIRVPQVLTDTTEPAAVTNLAPSYIDFTLNHWRGVRFGATDKELAFGGQKIINEHIRPGIYAISKTLDTYLATLYQGLPWEIALSSPAAVTDITYAQQILFDNGAPEDDGMLHLMLDGTARKEFLDLQAFSQFQGAGQAGVDTQMRGSLGMKYGFEVFANQNVQTSVPGTAVIGSQLQLNAEVAADATTLTFKDSGGSLTGNVKIGDTFVIAGNTQKYVITNNVSAGSNLLASVTFSPKAIQTYSVSANVTLTQTAASKQLLAFHRNCLGLAFGELPLVPEGLGVQSAVVTDEKSNLSIRLRRYYDKDTSAPMIALDVLYGVRVLDPNLGVRITNP